MMPRVETSKKVCLEAFQKQLWCVFVTDFFAYDSEVSGTNYHYLRFNKLIEFILKTT